MSLWSFLNGFLSLIVGYYEILRYTWLLKVRKPPVSYPVVREIWLERSYADIFVYAVGQLVFLSIPVMLQYFELLPPSLFCLTWVVPALFVVFSFLTLFIPVGVRKRYDHPLCRWMNPTATGYERLFLGQMPVDLLFGAKNEGAWSCLLELLSQVLLIVLLGGLTEYALWIDCKAAFNVPSDCSISPIDFLYWSVVTTSTVGYGDMYPKACHTQVVAIVQIAFGWMYLVALLPTIFNLVASAAAKGGER